MKTSVAIVGGGPVGLMLGLFLETFGVDCVVFNLEKSTRWHPKGSTHNARTVEHYPRVGMSPAIRNRGLPLDHPTDVAYFTRYNAWELARLKMLSEREKQAAVAASAQTDQVLEPLLRANQMYVERFLLESARARSQITLRFGWRVTEFAQDDGGVSLRAENVAGTAPAETWRAAYLVGCDGGASFVRRTLGIHYQGESTLEQDFLGGPMIATYLRAPRLYPDALAARRAWIYWAVNPEFGIVLIAVNGRDEFLLFNKLAAGEETPDDRSIINLVRRAAGFDAPVEIIGHFPWTAGVALVAERFADRRVFLVRDSAHLFTPTGGFGMNTGIDDTSNLAWKLAAMVHGWGGRHLLDTYELERRPVAIRNTTAARELAKNIGEIRVPPETEEDSPRGAAARARLGAFLSTFGEEFASLGVQLGARYDGSPLIVGDGVPPRDDFIRYLPSAVPGGRTPHLWLASGRTYGSSLFDHLGLGFTLLRLGADPPGGRALEAAARRRGMPFRVLDVAAPVARELYESSLALVRPDQYLAWRGDRVPDDPERLLARLAGDLPAGA